MEELLVLVRCKTLIYCGQLYNNAVNYPSTPLTPQKIHMQHKTAVY
jgi:hypothetical protein